MVTITVSSSTPNTGSYQEEMCEKLIQLSFVKIVSSKTERGGARLRKNLLILHLLQKARMEQRNRLVAAARNAMAASQRPELTNVASASSSTDEQMEIDHEEQRPDTPAPFSSSVSVREEDEEEEKIDANFSQQTTTNILEQSPTPVNNAEEGGNADAGVVGISSCNDVVNVEIRTHHQPEVEHCSLNQESTARGRLDGISNGEKLITKRTLKRKSDDSLQNASSTSLTSPKIPCMVYHQSVVQQQSSSPHQAQQQSTNLGLYSETSSVAPLSRNLSCSNFVELTCES